MELTPLEPAGVPLGTVVLLHGFTRHPRDLQAPAERFAALGARVLRPRLGAWWWPRSTNRTRYLTHIAEAVAQARSTGPLIVVGHSAGAPAGAWIAAALRNSGTSVDALILVDGVESPARTLRRAWPDLTGVPVDVICAPPSRCNRNGALARWLDDYRESGQPGPSVGLIVIPGMGHGDVEGPGRHVYVRWCHDDPAAPALAELEGTLDGLVERALDAVAK